MEWCYTVTVFRSMSSLEDGSLWTDMLPDKLHEERYGFDGWEAGMLSESVQSYELFWYPKTLAIASELLAFLDSMKEHILFEGCNFRLTILPVTW